MASATVYVTMRFPIRDRKAFAAVTQISVMAQEILEDQPWNDEAKRIADLASKLLKRARIKQRRNSR